jgi:replication-associated recombination protein RarA
MVPLIDVLRRNAAGALRRPGRPTERIMLAHAVLALCRAPKSRVCDDFAAWTSHRIESEGEKLEIPDYALDFHTKRGRAKGRQIGDAGWTHWAKEGCKLSNEVERLNVYFARALALRKKHGRLKERPAAGARLQKKRERNLMDMFDVVENKKEGSRK